MTNKRKSAGCTHSLQYHLVWCPKFRRGVLTGEIADALDQLLQTKASELGVDVLSLAIRPHYVHLFGTRTPRMAVNQLVRHFKGYTAHELRQRFPALKSRLPSLWSRSYYAGSIGQVSDETVRRYIEAQKGV